MGNALVELVIQATTVLPSVSRRVTRGGTAWYAQGEMFALVTGDQVALKLSPEDRDRALSLEGARLFDPAGGRPARSLVSMPPAVFHHPGTLSAWLHKSHAFVAVSGGIEPGAAQPGRSRQRRQQATRRTRGKSRAPTAAKRGKSRR